MSRADGCRLVAAKKSGWWLGCTRRPMAKVERCGWMLESESQSANGGKIAKEFVSEDGKMM